MLRLTRKIQQGVVIEPHKATDKPIVIRIIELLPGMVSIGFEGEDYKILRSEIYRSEDG